LNILFYVDSEAAEPLNDLAFIKGPYTSNARGIILATKLHLKGLEKLIIIAFA
jgi:hypothetical protein